MNVRDRDFLPEFEFSASRSSGPGGQNVNKVSTKVELRFNINNSVLLTDEEKEILLSKLSNKINNVGELIIVSQSERSQIKNKEKTIARFYKMIEQALTSPKKRKKSVPTKSSVEKRLKEKQITAQKKADRKDPELLE
jgi:ribosome-associated protein